MPPNFDYPDRRSILENQDRPLKIEKFFSFNLILALSVLLGILLLTQFLAYQQLSMLKNAQSAARNAEAFAVKERLETTIRASVAATSTLGFIVENYGIPKNFDRVAEILLSGTHAIDAVELFDSGTITHVYPLVGNEGVIGYNILSDPSRNKEALLAIEKGELFFAGPVELKQGGYGIIGRLPLYRDSVFIGFSAVLIKLSTFAKSSGITDYHSGVYRYQLIKTNVNTGVDEQFFPGEQIDVDELCSVAQLDEGNWQLCVQNRAILSWLDVKWISFLGLALAVLGGLITYRLAMQPNKLRLLVHEKKHELNRERQKFKDSFSHSYYGKALINIPSESISDYNPRFLEILGLNKSNTRDFWDMPWKSWNNSGTSNTSEFLIIHPDNSEHWISFNITPLKDEFEEYSHICTLFDITEEKNLQLNVEQAFRQRNEILESIGDAFFSLDKALNITYWNKQAENLLIHKRENILGKNLLEVFGDFIRPEDMKRGAPQIAKGHPIHFKQHIPRLEKWFDVSVYPFSSGTAVYFSDITETVKHVAAIEKRNEKLTEIAWIQSHIVRAPLARMMGIITLLEMKDILESDASILRKQLLIAAHDLDAILFDIVEKANLIEREVKEVVA